ncbi:hypothetical protein SAMD00019534_025970 [Acytostelium subglobosum LB1]|uniref:hypothetical protein n=1 Tax=Acytostelium subglobosum LB1 TaxID=1410327 RepID=UPI000644F044|nr:hypothetical protein SAMD00019534_025970 [Acytostelium subglobosum LB1]GAM19422.1 hypothetical protein SAMD00019534_025970 [Acytostelium subglobosum LB1]|eukprot:XP_012757349.1 hypothetical protein SAMD00019534_025970 [Acytostelium subglobosum LB1]
MVTGQGWGSCAFKCFGAVVTIVGCGYCAWTGTCVATPPIGASCIAASYTMYNNCVDACNNDFGDLSKMSAPNYLCSSAEVALRIGSEMDGGMWNWSNEANDFINQNCIEQ